MSEPRDVAERLVLKARMARAGERSCYGCRHLTTGIESSDMPHIWWWECAQDCTRENLRSFPFLNTTCKLWEVA